MMELIDVQEQHIGSTGDIVEPLSKAEQTLFEVTARWLCAEMTSRLRHTSPKPDLLHDLAQSNFEFGDTVLKIKPPRSDVRGGLGLLASYRPDPSNKGSKNALSVVSEWPYSAGTTLAR